MVRLRNSRSGMIGSLALDPTKMKISSSASAPPAIAPVCQDSQSYLSPAKVTQTSSRQTAAVTKKAPAQSTLTFRLTTGRCSVRWSTIIAMTREGHADVEAPAPPQPAGVGDDAADQWAADGPGREGAPR